MFVRVLFSLKHFLRYPPPTSDLSVFHILMSMVFDQERCMEWYIFTQFKRRLRRYKVQRHSSICFQRGFLRNAYATKTLVGTFQRVLWMFLYVDNFACWKNFRITPYINYAFCVINNASALLSSKTMVNSPEYCIYTSVKLISFCVLRFKYT